MHDPHMHERGMLQRFDHRELGNVVLPHSPLRFLDTEPLPLTSNARDGEHDHEIYGEWLGLTTEEIEALEREGVI
jgi:crotonobetainyl-CoA:carnitine CoA-transferase CaiB-like acyl-CoA transferase